MTVIKKAVIPAAGLGTRFLPATKAQPKEMLPIVDKPTIQYVVEEAIAAGIEDIIIVTGRGKRAIEDHFDKAYELEDKLKASGRENLLYDSEKLLEKVNIYYTRQSNALGLGHAVYCARKFIGDEPFAVLLGDDIVSAEKPCLCQMMDYYNKYQKPVLGIQEVKEEDVSKYGIIAPGEIVEDGLYQVNDMVEKPEKKEAPSHLAVMGRYLLPAQIFKILETLSPGRGGEIQLTDAIKIYNENNPILGYRYTGRRYDIGDKVGFIKANIEFALKRPDLNGIIHQYICEIVKEKSY